MSKPITIHKHTPKRYKRSVWVVSNIMSIDGVTMYSTNCTAPMLVQAAPMLVQDIKTGLENPLDLSTSLGSVEMWNEWGQDEQQKGDWNKWHKDMNSMSLEGCDGCGGCSPEFYKQEPKPSLLTKLKNRFKK